MSDADLKVLAARQGTGTHGGEPAPHGGWESSISLRVAETGHLGT